MTTDDTQPSLRDALRRFRDGAASADELASLLAPLVRRVAAEVTKGGPGRDDFIDDALAELFAPRAKAAPRISGYDPDREFLPWLAATLRNAWFDRTRRKERPTTALVDGDALAAPSRDLPWSHAMDLLGVPFSVADEAAIRRWTPRDRVEALCLSGLYVKLEALAWDGFLCDYENATGRPLPRPFPTTVVSDAGSPRVRTRPLAAALGIDKPNSLSVRWSRHKERLGRLDFVQELRDSIAGR